MKFLPVIALFALWGCAANKPAAEQANAGGDKQWCEKLKNMDDDFKNTLYEIAKDGSSILGENNEIIGHCDCISIIKCDDLDYCSTEQCPTQKRNFLE